MIYGVLGPRDFHGVEYANEAHIGRCMGRFLDVGDARYPKKMITGGSRGVERLVSSWCAVHNIPVAVIPPKYKEHVSPDKAFMARNGVIVDTVDEFVIFWDGRNKFIEDVISRATKRGIVVTVFTLA